MLWGIYSGIYGEVNVSVEKCVEIKGDYVEKQQSCFISVTLKSLSGRKLLDPTAYVSMSYSITFEDRNILNDRSLQLPALQQIRSVFLRRRARPSFGLAANCTQYFAMLHTSCTSELAYTEIGRPSLVSCTYTRQTVSECTCFGTSWVPSSGSPYRAETCRRPTNIWIVYSLVHVKLVL